MRFLLLSLSDLKGICYYLLRTYDYLLTVSLSQVIMCEIKLFWLAETHNSFRVKNRK